MTHECTEARFLNDIAEHEMIVLRDDGVYRHISFKKPGTSCMHFDLITWPGYLCYTGDMGTYVFSRLLDMFEFFRTDREYMLKEEGKTLKINLGYWSEKAEATDKNDGLTEFDEDKFRRVINDYRVGWMRDLKERGTSKEDRRELWESVENEVMGAASDGEHRASAAAYEFSEKVDGYTFMFEDLFEQSFDTYTHRFRWCCYALAWGIQQYDNAKLSEST